MNSLTRIMSYDKTKKNQESCNCRECVSTENVKLDNQIVEYPKLSETEIEQIISEKYSDKDNKTKIFIRKALRIHGDRYDYSNVVYIKAKEYVEIICKVEGHKPFPQTPNNHLNNHGCLICGIEKRAKQNTLTTEEFIKRAKKIYGDKYDYSESKYINNETLITIICTKEGHGAFSQFPYNHLSGHGCYICGNISSHEKQKLTLDEFIKNSNKIHGFGRYDYSKVFYDGYNKEVCIICHEHDTPYEFWLTPHLHIRGCGCSLCNESIGNSKVRMFLINNHIKFEREKQFENCRYKNPLFFDFYLPQYNLCIEFDGGQHFRKVKWTKEITDEQMEENLKLIQLRDQIKNEYCKNNNINLLRIKYNENVEEKLIEYFQNHNIIIE